MEYKNRQIIILLISLIFIIKLTIGDLLTTENNDAKVTEISLDDLPESGDIWEMSQDPESAKSDTLKELGADSASTVTPEKLVEDFQSENIDKDSGHQTSAVVEESDDTSDVDISQIFQPIYINKKLFYFGPRVFYPHRYFIPKYYYRHRFYKICTIQCKYAVIPYFM
nr:15463_t:CDS:1 [Entrophospora candida]